MATATRQFDNVLATHDAPAPEFNRRLTIYALLFTMAMLNYLDRVVLSVDAQAIAKEYGLSPVALGYLFSSFLWTYIICQIPAGAVVDRFGGRKPLAIGVGLWSLATMLTSLSTSYLMLLLTRLGLGVGESVSLPAAGKIIRENAPLKERGFAFALMNSGLYAGPAFGVILVAWVTAKFGWRGAFLMSGGLGFVWLLAWFIWRPRSGAESTGIAARASSVDVRTARTGASTGQQYKLLLSNPTMWGVFLTQGCSVYTQYLFLSWLPSYLQTTRHLSIMNTGIYGSIPFAAAVVLGILFSKYSDRILSEEAIKSGRRRTMIVAMLLMSSVILATPFVDDLWMIVLLFSVSLSGIATAIGLNFALVTEMVREPSMQGKASAIMVIGGNSFGLLAPIITGYILGSTNNFTLAFMIAGTLLVLGACASFFMTRRPIM